MMNISGVNSISSVASSISQASTGDAVAIAVLKKTLDIQAQTAMQLIAALPQPVASSPPNLGGDVNTYA
jgi:hypothetical protein